MATSDQIRETNALIEQAIELRTNASHAIKELVEHRKAQEASQRRVPELRCHPSQ